MNRKTRRCAPIFLPLLFAVLLPGCKELFGGGSSEPELDFPATTTEKAIVDADYQFELKPPGGGWRLMGEKEIQKMAPDALAGAVHPAGMFGVVIVEPAPEADTRSMAELIINNMPLENKQVSDYEEVVYAGQKATRVSVEGQTEGLRFRYVNHVLIHQGYCYQIMGGGLAQRADAAGFQAFFQAFKIRPGQVQARSPAREIIDSSGVGWRVKGGVFESAVFGLRVEPRGSWRLAVGAELEQMNSNAEVGLTSEHAYLILVAERAAGQDKKAFAERLRRDMAASIEGVPADEPLTVQLDGRTLTLHRMRTQSKPEFHYLHGVLFEGDMAIQVLYWHLAGLREQAQAQLPDALASIRLLTAAQSAELTTTLAAEGDPQNRVGPGYSLRRGIWRDFEHGLMWTQPAGFWRVSPGEQARAFNPDASLVIEHPRLGIFGMLIVEPAGNMTLRAHHDLVAGQAFSGDSQITEQAKPARLGKAPALQTAGRKHEQGLLLRYRLITCLHGGLAIQFAFWGAPDNMRASAAAIEQALAGFQMPGQAQKERSQDKAAYRDLRLGFSLDLSAGDWSTTDLTPDSLRGVGGVLDFRAGGTQLLVIAVCALGAGQDKEWFMRFIEETMRRKMAGLKLNNPTRSQVQLSGETWERLSFRGPVKADTHLTMRDKTFYGLMILHHKPGPPTEKLIQMFRFVD